MFTSSCERDLSDDATLATFPKTGEIYTDSFVSMGSDFYLPFADSKPDAFSIDNEEGYQSNSSIRIDVPNAVDPNGNYAGAIFRVDGAPRDLTGFNALTFWVKASRGVSIDAIGFGQDFLGDKYQVTANNVNVDTNWSQVTIPIPDASKLIEERGAFWYAMGTQGTGGSAYIVWFDEIKFVNLATVAQPRPAISNGNDIVTNSFTGVNLLVSGLIETFSLGSGADQVVTVAPNYYNFTSSDESVATVDDLGNITVNAAGTTTITATLGSLNAAGSLTINSQGAFQLPPAPTLDASRVISIFSDVYTNVPVDYYNGFWLPGSSTGSADFSVNGDNILNYTDFNYVGTQTGNPLTDASNMTMIHFDMYVPGVIPPNFDFLISIEDWGANGIDNGGDDTRQQIFVRRNQVVADTWISIDAPLTLVNKNNIGLIIYENINGSSLRNFYLDNVYYYN
ncbi:Ig-like domain-containing protein [Nonlabens dokdonensis]|uniref:Glycosyl hydrolase, family 16 n=2 Tax=Nonlabens dokdonensis TaxID=328515 RepID=L7W729_NONDD|nr:Ig-like domain-containing protein [Nonlabens dokdonensis]AGC77485.1 glycosyl hydrolase, family 16 [Nonlabens dokdonensis DSW-6]